MTSISHKPTTVKPVYSGHLGENDKMTSISHKPTTVKPVYSGHLGENDKMTSISHKPTTVKPVYSGHLGENDKMTTIHRWPLYGGFEFSTRYCTFVVNKHFLITCYVCLLFCSCGHVTELTLVYIYCWWSYLKVILNKPVSSIL